MTPVQRGMLTRLGQFSRDCKWFTSSQNGYQGMPEKQAQRNLNELEQAGHIIQTKTGYKLTQSTRAWLDGPGKIVGVARFVNASQQDTYKPAAWSPARAEGNDHLQHKSHGMGPQIVRIA